MSQRLLVIQEHNAVRAGLHWDIRFEAEGDTDLYCGKRPVTNEPMPSPRVKYDRDSHRVLRSFVIPKHRLPEAGEKLLAVRSEDHPWEYKDFEGTIEQGYGEGVIQLLHNDYIEVEEFTDDKIIFEYQGAKYMMYKARWTGKDNTFMFIKK